MPCRPGFVLLAAIVLAGCGSETVTAPKLPDAPSATDAVATGFEFTCALTSIGRPFCWGDNSAGQLGDSTLIPELVPVQVHTDQKFVGIFAGHTTVCGLDHIGGVWCWGDDPTRPGVSASYQRTPRQIGVPRAIGTLAIGDKFVCGLDGDGRAYCWGENGRGQLGVGDTVGRAAPTPVQGGIRFASIAAGLLSMCGVTTPGVAYCWGDNSFGELGTGDTAPSLVPKKVAGSHIFVALSGGAAHQCAVSDAGTAFCWGLNASGQLGDGTDSTRLVPTAVLGGVTFTSLRSHRTNSVFGSTCGITQASELYCWGWNNNGQLGVPASTTTDACTTVEPAGTSNNPGVVTFECSHQPLKVTAVQDVAWLDTGLGHTCAITMGAQLLCWGADSHGELGDGTGITQVTPVAPAGNLTFP